MEIDEIPREGFCVNVDEGCINRYRVSAARANRLRSTAGGEFLQRACVSRQVTAVCAAGVTLRSKLNNEKTETAITRITALARAVAGDFEGLGLWRLGKFLNGASRIVSNHWKATCRETELRLRELDPFSRSLHAPRTLEELIRDAPAGKGDAACATRVRIYIPDEEHSTGIMIESVSDYTDILITSNNTMENESLIVPSTGSVTRKRLREAKKKSDTERARVKRLVLPLSSVPTHLLYLFNTKNKRRTETRRRNKGTSEEKEPSSSHLDYNPTNLMEEDSHDFKDFTTTHTESSFFQLSRGITNRTRLCRLFRRILVLASTECTLTQHEPYSDITIRRVHAR